MSTPTTNYGYIKAADGEQYNVDITNNNLDAIDTNMFGKRDKTEPFGHMGRTGGFQVIGGTDVGVVMAAAQKLTGGMTFDNTNGGRLVIPVSGRYEIGGLVYGTVGSAYRCAGAAYKNAVKIPGTEIMFWKADGLDYATPLPKVEIDLVVGDKIGLGMTSTQSTAGTTGYNGSYLEVRYVGS